MANAKRAVKQAQTGRDFAGRQLAIVMDDPADKQYVVGEEVPTLDAADADLAADDKLIATALARRLELKALEAPRRSLSHGEAAMKVGPRAAPRCRGTSRLRQPEPALLPADAGLARHLVRRRRR